MDITYKLDIKDIVKKLPEIVISENSYTGTNVININNCMYDDIQPLMVNNDFLTNDERAKERIKISASRAIHEKYIENIEKYGHRNALMASDNGKLKMNIDDAFKKLQEMNPEHLDSDKCLIVSYSVAMELQQMSWLELTSNNGDLYLCRNGRYNSIKIYSYCFYPGINHDLQAFYADSIILKYKDEIINGHADLLINNKTNYKWDREKFLYDLNINCDFDIVNPNGFVTVCRD